MLLGAVVEVTLDPPTLGVGGGDHPRSRQPQLFGLSSQLRERNLQLRIEPDVAERESELACQLGENLLGGLVEWVGVYRAYDDDQAQLEAELPVYDALHAWCRQQGPGARVEEGRMAVWAVNTSGPAAARRVRSAGHGDHHAPPFPPSQPRRRRRARRLRARRPGRRRPPMRGRLWLGHGQPIKATHPDHHPHH